MLSTDELFSPLGLANFCHDATESVLRALLISTLILLPTLLVLGIWRKRAVSVRSFLIRAAYLAVVVSALLPFLPAPNLPSLWSCALAPVVQPKAGLAVEPSAAARAENRALQQSVSPVISSFSQTNTPNSDFSVASNSTAQSRTEDGGRTAFYEILVTIWFVGALFPLFKLGRTCRNLRQLCVRNSSVLRSGRVFDLAQQRYASWKLSQPPPILMTASAVESPFLVQMPFVVRQPTIFLPEKLVSELDEPELDAVILHELAHWRRRDCDWFLVAYVVSAVFWMQPLLHRLRRHLTETAEEACDEAVLSSGCRASFYSTLLVRLAEQLAARNVSWRSMAVSPGIVYSPTALERRIRLIMKRSQFDALSLDWISLPLWTRAIIAGGLSFGVVFGVMLFNRAPSPGESEAVHNRVSRANVVPEANPFPSGGSMPDGVVRAADVVFADPQYSPPTLLFDLTARCRDGKLQMVANPRREGFIGKHTPQESVIWSGEANDSTFALDTIAGRHTLRDADNREIWSDVSRLPAPNLQVICDAGSGVSLLDKSGKLLWSGQVYRTRYRGMRVSSDGRVQAGSGGIGWPARTHGRRIDLGWINIAANDGTVTVLDARGTRLWAGNMPDKPVVLEREGRRFVYCSGSRTEGGSDETLRMRFSTEIGTATVEDRNHVKLGVRPVLILKVQTSRSEIPQDAETQRTASPVSGVALCHPSAKLLSPGTVFISYQDASGRTIRRAKVYRDQDGRSSGTLD